MEGALPGELRPLWKTPLLLLLLLLLLALLLLLG
jgi:hypothetical protein